MLAFAVAWWLARRDGVDRSEALGTLGVLGVAAVLGARAWSLLEWWWAEGEIQWIWDPLVAAGYSSAGAFLGGGLALVASRFVFGRTAFAKLLDVVLPAGFVALALTRLGCLFERCDPGRPATFFGVRYPDGAFLQPFGGYLAGGTLAVAILAAFMHNEVAGRRAVALTVGYAAVRFLAELTRDAPTLIHAGHGLALLVGASAVAWWFVDGRKVGDS